MDPLLVAALIAAATKLEPALVELLIAAITHLTAQIQDQGATFAAIVPVIVQGIDDDHPEWDADTKRRYAADAVRQLATMHEVRIDDAAINALVEITVSAAKAPA